MPHLPPPYHLTEQRPAAGHGTIIGNPDIGSTNTLRDGAVLAERDALPASER
jgi:hypothetical protein